MAVEKFLYLHASLDCYLTPSVFDLKVFLAGD